MMSSSQGKLLLVVWLLTSAVIGARSYGNSGLGPDERGGVEYTGGKAKPEAGRELLCGEHDEPSASTRIWGGSDARPGEFPHQVYLEIKNSTEAWNFNCGGVLISRRFILTAAHCAIDPETKLILEPNRVRVFLGSHKMKEPQHVGGILAEVAKVVLHPHYGPEVDYTNDIALLKLVQPVNYFLSEAGFGSINRVCLPGQPNGVIGNNTKVVISGWGYIAENWESPTVLQKAELRIEANSDCKQAMDDEYDEEKQICTFDWNNVKSPHMGDSGSPLIRVLEDGRYELLGLVSRGSEFQPTESPVVHTRVSYYLDWVLDEAGLSSATAEPLP